MTRIYEGSYDGRNLRVAVVASRFNETIARSLLEGALDCLRRHGVSEQDITTVWVPGAFELPAAVRRLAASKEVDAIVTVGAVIRGETAHFEYVAGHAARGVGGLALEYDIPVTFGVLTTENVQQAADRAGGKLGNKGFEAAMAALEMANLFASLPKSLPEI
ncbi:MAG: 6,7-dimethyl-8-ribityllumazine synthase [Actinomycetota bacterium]|jgi:6,7-dimethyl-8-ribityllumazine synthase|nr:6,7-dimethyl-8-ribityllumazine synthase [Actinomycetota bacterium]